MDNTQLMEEKKFSARDLAIISMIAAICIVSTYIQVPAGSAMVHLGSAALFTAAILFGGPKAGWGAAVGSAIYDIVGGHMSVTLWTFIIKGIAGLIVGLMANSRGSRELIRNLTKDKSKGTAVSFEIVKNLIAALVGAAWTLAGYLVVWTFTLGSFEAAMGNAIFSILTSAVGIIIAIPLAAVLKKPLARFTN